MKRFVRIAILVLGALFVIGQFIPFPRTNPAADPSAAFAAVAAPPPEVQAIVERSCTDCHSHRTVWPWYSRVFPASWLVSSDVKDGRRHFNLSAWKGLPPQRAQHKLEQACEEVKGGDMPPSYYTLMHPRAKLTPQDVAALCGWVESRAH